MHIRTKFDRRKVINRTQNGSWGHRSMGAGIQQYMGIVWGPKVWKSMAKASPNKVVKDTADCSAKRLDKYRKQKGYRDSKRMSTTKQIHADR